MENRGLPKDFERLPNNREAFINLAALSFISLRFTVTVIPRTREPLPLTVRAIFRRSTREAVKKRRARCALFFEAVLSARGWISLFWG